MPVSVSSGSILFEIDTATGAISTIRNLRRDLDLVSLRRTAPPFRLALDESGLIDRFRDCSVEQLPSGLRVTWTTDHAVTLVSDIIARGEDILLTIAALNAGTATIDRIEYPIVDGIGRLGGPGQDELAHTHGTGMLFRDPLDLFEPDPENLRRLGSSPYPEGFAGATMQFMAYYARQRGGFLIGTEDPGRNLKWLNIAKGETGLTASVVHKAGAPRPGIDLAPAYPTVVAPLTRGSWYEAGDRYRVWAVAQPWATPGPRSRWLREEVGLCTFGINARHDRSAWLDAIHTMAGTPVFHVLGPNWAHGGQDYRSHVPHGLEDWFPAVFDDANLRTIRANGDYWAPFEFDLLCADPQDAASPVLGSRLALDKAEAGISDPGLLRFPFMCPATDYWHDVHVERDRRLVAEYGADATYYDISVNNVLLQCLAANHGHDPGGGEAIAEAFARMYRDTTAAMTGAAGRHVPSGAEMISELFIGAFDYYQARGESGPYPPFEVAAFRGWVLDGRAEKIPLFTYVFGERAPLRMDGWAKLSAESGDLFYWVAAQVVLNGGLFEVNAEFSALEDLAGHAEAPSQHYYPFDERHVGVDPAKAAFLGEIARTRVGPANPFLAHGSMLEPPEVTAPTVTLPYHAYNMSKSERLYDTRGEMQVPSASVTAWQRHGRVAWLVANILPEPQVVTVDGKRLEMPARQFRFVEV